MLHTHTVLFAVLTVFATACGRLEMDDQPNKVSEGARCAQLENKRFITVETQSDCGPVAPGTQIDCRWSVGFSPKDASRSAFAFHYSDLGDSGDVTCVGGIVMQIDGPHTGTYDPTTGQLEWNGIVYAVQ